ncbi:MAG: GGDEF domain-containing protein, partial [Calditrichaeota bacterium]
RSLSELESRLNQLEQRFAEAENLNDILSGQVRQYYLMYDAVRKLSTPTTLKQFYKVLDKIFRKKFNVDEYALIMKHQKSDMLSVYHSMGLIKRELREIFYRLNEGMVGKVFMEQRAVYIPDLSVLKKFSYYFERKPLKGCLYYTPVLDMNGICLGVLKMRKILKDSFTEVERAVLPKLQQEIGSTYINVQRLELLNSKSYVDDLTHLFNRRYYNEHFPVEFKRAQRYQHELSLMFIDIDNFKEINDHFGHSIGDTVLQNISNYIRQFTRSSDICIRYGGDEFLIILPETSRLAAYEVAAKLRKAVESVPVPLDGRMEDLVVSLSMGIASFPEDTIEPKMLVELADRALYQAKRSGKDQIVLANSLPALK